MFLHVLLFLSAPLAPPPVLGRSRPYQGVRVRDPVKELLRRKRGLESHSTKSAPPAVATSGSSGVPLATVSDGGLQCAGWKAPPTATTASFQPAVPPWSSSDYNQPDPSAQTLAYPATPALTADVYMQTLCPSYTMLTYTHTPLLTNIGTIPVASSPASLPQMDLQDSGLTYLPWAQPLTTISTMPTSGVQFSPGSAPLPGSPLVHMPLSMSLTTMIPQLEAQAQTLDEDQEVEPEPPNPLEKLLEDPKEEHEEEGKDTYSSSLFIPTV
uniref:OCA domain-containing protein n=1 Tax=Myripristis murdjan TaxID=586833 RepID=A0A667YNH4_9TELE